MRHIGNVSVDAFKPGKSSDSMHAFRQRLELAIADSGGYQEIRHILHNLPHSWAVDLRANDFLHASWDEAWARLYRSMPLDANDKRPFRERLADLTRQRWPTSCTDIRGELHRILQRCRSIIAMGVNPTAFVNTWDQLQWLLGAHGGRSAIVRLWIDVQEIVSLLLPTSVIPLLRSRWPSARKTQSFRDFDEFTTDAVELFEATTPSKGIFHVADSNASGAARADRGEHHPWGPCWCQPQSTLPQDRHWYKDCKYLKHHDRFKKAGKTDEAKAATLAAITAEK
jgi:hypothetical protein